MVSLFLEHGTVSPCNPLEHGNQRQRRKVYHTPVIHGAGARSGLPIETALKFRSNAQSRGCVTGKAGTRARPIEIALPGCTDSLGAPRPPDSSHPSRRFGPGCGVSDALLIAVSVGTEVARVGGLRVIAAVAAKLAIVLAVLHSLLEVHSVSLLIVGAVLVLAAILILGLLCGNCGSPASRAEPDEADSKCQHP